MFDCQAMAARSSELATIDGDSLERMLIGSPEIAVKLLKLIGRLLVESEMDRMLSEFGNVQSRLIALLMRLGAGTDEPISISQQEIGDILGKDRVTVNKTIGVLSKSGLVELAHRQIRIVDPEGLRALMWAGLD